MQIVIDINDEIYKEILNGKDGWSNYVHGLIRTGIPLPKGHGRLIDADKEIQRHCGKSCGCTLEECGYGFYCPLVQRMISAQTIIEADKAESEE